MGSLDQAPSAKPELQYIEQVPNKLSGRAVFKGTRVPVKNLFDYVSEGFSVEEFLEDHPSVSGEQVRFVLVNFSARAFE